MTLSNICCWGKRKCFICF